jgi:arylsulfatase
MMAVYAAVVHHLDKSIGDLVDGLKKRNLFDNTVIIFISDNGGNPEPGIEGIYTGTNPGASNTPLHIGQCWAEVNNTPFWLYKHHTSEGGIASPCIISWPNGLSPKLKGKSSNQVAHIIDIMPTFLDLAKGKYPETHNGFPIIPMQGITMAPLFDGKALRRSKPLFWEHEGNRAMRLGKWKIVSNVNEPWQLYNMEKDRTELNDLASAYPKKLHEMVSNYSVWYEAVNANPYFTKPKKWQYFIHDAQKNTDLK